MRKIRPGGKEGLLRGTASSEGGKWRIVKRSQGRPQYFKPEITQSAPKSDCLRTSDLLPESTNSRNLAGALAVSPSYFAFSFGPGREGPEISKLEAWGAHARRFRPSRTPGGHSFEFSGRREGITDCTRPWGQLRGNLLVEMLVMGVSSVPEPARALRLEFPGSLPSEAYAGKLTLSLPGWRPTAPRKPRKAILATICASISTSHHSLPLPPPRRLKSAFQSSNMS